MALPQGVSRVSGLQIARFNPPSSVTTNQSEVQRVRFNLGVGTNFVVGIHGLAYVQSSGLDSDGAELLVACNSNPDVDDDRSVGTVQDDDGVLLALSDDVTITTSGGATKRGQSIWTPEDVPIFRIRDVALEMVSLVDTSLDVSIFLYYAIYKASQQVVLDLASLSLSGQN